MTQLKSLIVNRKNRMEIQAWPRLQSAVSVFAIGDKKENHFLVTLLSHIEDNFISMPSLISTLFTNDSSFKWPLSPICLELICHLPTEWRLLNLIKLKYL